jgi:hypothetical protein
MQRYDRPKHILPQDLSQEFKDRFLTHFRQSDGCWIWFGCRNRFGYGQIHYALHPCRFIMAHRASWLIFKGEIPKGIQVLHHCDIPWCISPDHLFLGTQQDNVDDMWNKGRANVESAHHALQKLTSEQAVEIQRLYATGGYFHRHIATMFGVSTSTIKSIVNRQVGYA